MSIADGAQSLSDSAGGAAVDSIGAKSLLPHKALEIVLPLAIFVVALLVWEAVVRLNDIPPYILPSPVSSPRPW